MRKTIPSYLSVLMAGSCLAFSTASADNPPPDPQALSNPNISRYVIAAGGQASAGGYVLHSTIGQPLAATSTGGGYTLKSGYHSEDDLIFRHDLDQ